MFSPTSQKSKFVGYEINNKYNNFPPLMNDSRSLISTWGSESKINEKIIKENDIQNNWKYRKYLTKNAKIVMQHEFYQVADNVGYRVDEHNKSTFSSIKFDSLNDRTKPFQNSDLKELYLTREQLNAKKIAPVFVSNN